MHMRYTTELRLCIMIQMENGNFVLVPRTMKQNAHTSLWLVLTHIGFLQALQLEAQAGI